MAKVIKISPDEVSGNADIQLVKTQEPTAQASFPITMSVGDEVGRWLISMSKKGAKELAQALIECL